MKCSYCGKPNHTRETCWDLHGRPSTASAHSAATTDSELQTQGSHDTHETRSSSTSSDQLPVPRDELEGKGNLHALRTLHLPRGHSQISQVHLPQPITFSSPSSSWIIDSGASDRPVRLLTELLLFPVLDTIRLNSLTTP